MSLMTENAGNMDVLAHDPTAIRALKVCEFMLCCMKDTCRRPVRACAWNECGSACNVNGSCACAWNIRVSLFIIVKYMVVLG